jgi:methylated-DNA-[protein]-cysteine S-methyltransferase
MRDVHPWTQVEGPIGPLFVAWGRAGIALVERAGDAPGFELDVMLRTGRPALRVDRMPAELAGTIARQLAGEWQRDLPLDLSSLTAFGGATLRKTMEIPWGEVRPYAWVAREIGRPRAVRAVGSALGDNPLPFLVPCHRVIRADGHIGQYGGGGPEAKVAMLATEDVDVGALEMLANEGIRYLGSELTMEFCFPSCRHARAMAAHDAVRLRHGEDAIDAGFTPCADCRPFEAHVFRA